MKELTRKVFDEFLDDIFSTRNPPQPRIAFYGPETLKKLYDEWGSEKFIAFVMANELLFTNDEGMEFINSIFENKLEIMKNPKQIQCVVPGSVFIVPTFKVSNDGIVDGKPIEIRFCKGNKEDGNVFRQEGFFTETLIQVSKMYLEDVNTGELANRECSMAITKLDEALMWIQKRADDRILRGVQTTYRK